MKKVLGTPNQYYSQSNNAQVYLFKDYFNSGINIACGPTVFAMALDICLWPLVVFAPGIQPEDSILMIMHNPFNLDTFRNVRDIDYDLYPPNEVPQLYPVVAHMLYNNVNVCKFKWGVSFDMIKYCIDNDMTVMCSGNFPAGGHYVLFVGYEDDTLIFNDPYKEQWEDKNGYNRIMTREFFDNNIKQSGYRLEIYKNKGA